jgi:hypothetical protein
VSSSERMPSFEPIRVVPAGWTRTKYRETVRRVRKLEQAVVAGKMSRDEFVNRVAAMGLRVKESV